MIIPFIWSKLWNTRCGRVFFYKKRKTKTASAGNQTRVWPVAGAYSITELPTLSYKVVSNSTVYEKSKRFCPVRKKKIKNGWGSQLKNATSLWSPDVIRYRLSRAFARSKMPPDTRSSRPCPGGNNQADEVQTDCWLIAS